MTCLPALLDPIGQGWATPPTAAAAQLGAIATPILVLDGEEEDAIAIADTRETAGLIPGSELVPRPGAGQVGLLDQPRACNRIVLDSLTGEPG